MNNTVFDPLNIILLVIAIVVAWKLRSVLGTRTGHEKRIELPLPSKRQEAPATAGGKEKNPQEDDIRYGLPEEETPVWEGVAEEHSLLARMLQRMKEIDASFDARHFLEGAKTAYEMIVTAFAEGDRKTLKPLLDREVFERFSAVIDERRKQGLTQELQFVGLDETKLVKAALDGKVARLTVKFTSKVITAVRDAQGNVVEGDPQRLVTVKDVWTFERDLTSKDPNWRLVSTEAPE